MQAAHGQTVTALVPQGRAGAAAAALAAEFRLEAADGEVEPAAVLQPVTMLSLVEEGLREVTTLLLVSVFIVLMCYCRVPALCVCEALRGGLLIVLSVALTD
jgi:hypothetical protein